MHRIFTSVATGEEKIKRDFFFLQRVIDHETIGYRPDLWHETCHRSCTAR